MSKKREKMDAFVSVFNRHVNDAAEKAKADFVEKFGQEAWDEIMKPLDEAGIMIIFDKGPTEHTQFYVDAVEKHVNEGVEDTEDCCGCDCHDDKEEDDGKDRNGNNNCMKEFQCPGCEQSDQLDVVGRSQFRLMDDGTDGHTAVEYDDDSMAACPECEFQGTLEDFRKAYEEAGSKEVEEATG